MSKADTACLSAAETSETAFAVPVGTLVSFLSESESRIHCKIIEGPLTGNLSWVEFEYLRFKKAGEFR